MMSNENNGTFDKIKGSINETVGKITGDKELEGKGKGQQARGEVEEKVNQAKNAFNDAKDDAQGRLDGFTNKDEEK
ncbi:CsbD family protein [Aerococcus sp. 1KP-2016]|uniref:CsbD family protein n=1 Tax=Aerococcus sp. 1KP-2016 TaxID=1981982 RepID=UPI001F406AAA|nr:CsbD family protein [Aerococcus sp. 1KP-2016]